MTDLVKCALAGCSVFFRLQKGKRFCSDACRKESQRSKKAVKVTCTHCGNENEYLLKTIFATNNKPKFKGHGNAKNKRESS